MSPYVVFDLLIWCSLIALCLRYRAQVREKNREIQEMTQLLAQYRAGAPSVFDGDDVKALLAKARRDPGDDADQSTIVDVR